MSALEPDANAAELTRVQQWFQAVITNGEGIEVGAASAEAQRLIRLPPGELAQVVTRSRALTAAERLAIYANAYHSRLLECLGEVFPILKRTLAEEAFDGLAFGYLQQYPSRTYTLNELGRHFPRYLEETRPAADSAEEAFAEAGSTDAERVLEEGWPDFLIDLARLEWAIYEVFDGPGVEGLELLGARQLLGISSESWPKAKLKTVVCLELLSTRFPVNDYFTKVRKSAPAEVVPMPAAAESFVALTRREFVVRRYNLSRPEYELLKALKQGCTVEQAVESTLPVAGDDVDRLAGNLEDWFRRWTLEGFFESIIPGGVTR